MDLESKISLPEAEIYDTDADIIASKNVAKKKSYVENPKWISRLRSRIADIIMHSYFHIAVICLVLLDTAVVVTEVMVESSNKDGSVNHSVETAEHVLHYTSLGILSVFMLEIAVKIFAIGLDFFKQKFEVFDAIVVIVSFFLDVFLSRGGMKDGVELLILLRLWRIARIINGIIVSIKSHEEEKQHKLAARLEEVEEELRKVQQLADARQAEIEMLKERLVAPGTSMV